MHIYILTMRGVGSVFRWKELCKKGKEDKVPLKNDDKDILERIGANLKKALMQKEAATTTEEKLKAGQAVEEAKNAQRQVIHILKASGKCCFHLFVLRLGPTPENDRKAHV